MHDLRTPLHASYRFSGALLSVSLLTAVGASEMAADESVCVAAQRFDFGAGPVQPGWIGVVPEMAYDLERGYGFDLGTNPDAASGSGDDALVGDSVTSSSPFYFSTQLPEGNYNVTVWLGDTEAGSTNTIKAESRRLMLERVVTQPGEVIKREFTVSVRTPAIADGSSVRLKSREEGVLHWDNKLTIEFNGARPAVCGLEITPATNAITVYLLGDSTVTDQPKEPWNSWGQMLTRFFQPGVAVANHAESGESLKSSIGARRVKKVMTEIQPGDYLFVQFGHNDMKDKATNALEVYRSNLKQLAADTRERGATPVLITSMERMSGVEKDTLAGYPQTVREVAAEDEVALIDLHAMSRAFYQALGDELKVAFQDGTHHNAYGSYELARCIVLGIQENRLPLADHLADDVVVFDPASPDSWKTFNVPASPDASLIKPDGD